MKKVDKLRRHAGVAAMEFRSRVATKISCEFEEVFGCVPDRVLPVAEMVIIGNLSMRTWPAPLSGEAYGTGRGYCLLVPCKGGGCQEYTSVIPSFYDLAGLGLALEGLESGRLVGDGFCSFCDAKGVVPPIDKIVDEDGAEVPL